MNKIIRNLLPIFFILINTINISAITYAELEEDQKNAYKSLLACIIENNIREFIRIFETKNNFELTNVSETSLVEEIINIHHPEVNKRDFFYTLYKYGMLNEVVQQVKAGTRIKRFHKIYELLRIYLERNKPIDPETILSSGRKQNNPTSLYWYISKFVIEKNNILNLSFRETLNWFINETIWFASSRDIEIVEENLEMVPFMIKMKYENSYFINKIREHLGQEDFDNIKPTIMKIKEQLQRPSRCTAFLRYSIFT